MLATSLIMFPLQTISLICFFQALKLNNGFMELKISVHIVAYFGESLVVLHFRFTQLTDQTGSIVDRNDLGSHILHVTFVQSIFKMEKPT